MWILNQRNLVLRAAELFVDVALQQVRELSRIVAAKRFQEHRGRFGRELKLHVFRRDELQVLPVTVPFSRMVPALNVSWPGTGSVIATEVAAALPLFATAMQYSTTAPGISFGFVVLLNGSEMTRLVLVTASVAVCTV